jgi:hypothetical protein
MVFGLGAFDKLGVRMKKLIQDHPGAKSGIFPDDPFEPVSTRPFRCLHAIVFFSCWMGTFGVHCVAKHYFMIEASQQATRNVLPCRNVSQRP